MLVLFSNTIQADRQLGRQRIRTNSRRLGHPYGLLWACNRRCKSFAVLFISGAFNIIRSVCLSHPVHPVGNLCHMCLLFVGQDQN